MPEALNLAAYLLCAQLALTVSPERKPFLDNTARGDICDLDAARVQWKRLDIDVEVAYAAMGSCFGKVAKEDLIYKNAAVMAEAIKNVVAFGYANVFTPAPRPPTGKAAQQAYADKKKARDKAMFDFGVRLGIAEKGINVGCALQRNQSSLNQQIVTLESGRKMVVDMTGMKDLCQAKALVVKFLRDCIAREACDAAMLDGIDDPK